MKKTVGYVTVTILLVLIIFGLASKTVQSQNPYDMKEQEAYYRLLEKEYLAEVRTYLNSAGLNNCGVMLTRVVEADGNREYTITIHHSRLDKFSVEDKVAIMEELREFAFEGENCSFIYSLSGNA